MEDKARVEEKARQLIEMTGAFCDRYLDAEYKQLCQKLILKMSRKRNVPFMTGRLDIWAAATVYALGSINFLFDRSFKPYIPAEDLCKSFGTSPATTSSKARLIRNMFKMRYFDREFSTSVVAAQDPLKDMATLNGLIVDRRMLPEIEKLTQRKTLF
ncbi:MAG: hypothetical protein HY673_04565 [Chloroflexi bacterium]|nr:hypothetical protein [Chloroflexota bacterium]